MKARICMFTINALARKQAGLTLIEAVAFLAIFGLVIAGALALYNSASTSQTKTELQAQITSVRGLVRELYQGGNYPNGSMNSVLVASKRLPATLNASPPADITTSAGGVVTVTGNGSTFTMTFTGISSDVCKAILPNIHRIVTWTQAITITQGATSSILYIPVTPATAASICTAEASIRIFSN